MEKLAAVVKQGWARKHPVTEEQKQAVARVVREQSAQEQTGAASPPAASAKIQPKRRGQGPDLGRER
jgi:hypothetical protein